MYAGVAQRIHDETGGRVNFIVSLKGGGNCQLWAGELVVVVVQLLYVYIMNVHKAHL